MNRQELFAAITAKQSYLCVGLDTDLQRIPAHLQKEDDPLFAFNKAIIDATQQYAVAYKPNLAFYEAHGTVGWEALQKTMDYIPEGILTIADAKRGDIGNTAGLYARAFYEAMAFDGVTLAPYMGADSVTPFLAYPGKWAIILGLTSNPSATDFETLPLANGAQPLWQKVMETSQAWGTTDSIMYVVGATRAEMLQQVRQVVPEHFLLVPGVGAQGGSLEGVSRYGMNSHCGLLVNSSRGIIYASNGLDFQEAASKEAASLQQQMALYLSKYLPQA